MREGGREGEREKKREGGRSEEDINGKLNERDE